MELQTLELTNGVVEQDACGGTKRMGAENSSPRSFIWSATTPWYQLCTADASAGQSQMGCNNPNRLINMVARARSSAAVAAAAAAAAAAEAGASIENKKMESG
jgi:hypothetical protein